MVSERIAPRPVAGASAWCAADVDDEASYTRWFHATELDEIDRAVQVARSAGRSAEDITSAEEFPLPVLGPSLRRLQGTLEDGLGFAVLRGLPVEKYSLDDQKVLVMGLLSHLGAPVCQDTKGTLVEVVTDRGLSYEDHRVRGYMTSAELTPHCDSGDVVGLLCVRRAVSGGASRLCSGAAIHNVLAETTPELLEPLYRGFHHNIRGNGPPGAEDVTLHRVPVFSQFEGRLSIRYNLKAILTAELLPGVAPLSDLERRAVERVAELALRPDLRLEMTLQPGDVQLLNNHAVLHTRTAYEDDPDPRAKRLLLRVWVNLPNGRALEDGFADHFNTGPRQPPAQKP